MSLRFFRVFSFFLLATAALAACDYGRHNTTYSASEIGRSGQVLYGTIVDMQPATVRPDSTPVGTAGGGALGAIAGSRVGGGSTAHWLGGVAGGVAGAVAGHYAEKGIMSESAYAFIIRLSNGSLISVVQSNEYNFRAGDHVIVSGAGNAMRLIPAR